MWTSNFTAVDFRDSWGKMHEEEQKVAEEVWEPPVEIENSEAETEEAENAETSTKPVMISFQKRRRSSCRVRFCQQQNRSEKSIRIL